MYSTWQPFGQALIMDSLLLSYIDVQHTNFLPLNHTVGEARDIGPRYTCSDELAPIWDESAEVASRYLWECAYEAVQCEVVPAEPEAPAQEAEQEVVESSDSSRTQSVLKEMVTHRTLIVSRFIPSTSQTMQQQPPQGHGPAPPAYPPPPPPSGRPRKRQRVAELTSTSLGDVQIQTPPQLLRGITIREPRTQVGTNVASSSRPAQLWQPTFELDGTPLPASANVWAWEKGEGRREKGVVLPKAWCTVSFCLRM